MGKKEEGRGWLGLYCEGLGKSDVVAGHEDNKPRTLQSAAHPPPGTGHSALLTQVMEADKHTRNNRFKPAGFLPLVQSY